MTIAVLVANSLEYVMILRILHRFNGKTYFFLKSGIVTLLCFFMTDALRQLAWV
jgi:hypothetical protein